jgi:hypothetical protein
MTWNEPNPFPDHAAEHQLWEWWRRAYFRQPVHSQLFDLESRFRVTLVQLLAISTGVESQNVQRTIRASLLELESTIDALTQTAEVAYARAIAGSTDGDPGSDGNSEQVG